MTDLEKKILDESVDLEKVAGGVFFDDDDYEIGDMYAKMELQYEAYAREHEPQNALTRRMPRKRQCASERAITMARRAHKRARRRR